MIKRYTGSAEQAAAVNAAIKPADVLFAENFDGGIVGWHGKGENIRPESAMVTEDLDGNHGMVMKIPKCNGGGDAYSVGSFDCTYKNQCRISFYMKGRAWQGFSTGYPDLHMWSATAMEYGGAHVRTVHDTGIFSFTAVMIVCCHSFQYDCNYSLK